MSHLLCLNSRTTIPTSAHTSVFVSLLNNPGPPGPWLPLETVASNGDAYYTDELLHGNSFLQLLAGSHSQQLTSASLPKHLKVKGIKTDFAGLCAAATAKGRELYAEDHAGATVLVEKSFRSPEFANYDHTGPSITPVRTSDTSSFPVVPERSDHAGLDFDPDIARAAHCLPSPGRDR